MNIMNYQCPICNNPLSLSSDEKYLSCQHNHQFDKAKQGYFNLLPVQNKKTKEPGDSKEMINARERFLSGGYYQQLAHKLSQTIDNLVDNTATILDIGCGEGFYSRAICDGKDMTCYGIDISKAAVIKAAKKHNQGHYCVASSEQMPLQSSCIDLAFKVYAPVSDSELNRVITDNGFLVNVTPAPRHLWQLREFIYDSVTPHDTADTCFDGFEKISSEQLSYIIEPTPENRLNLLQMTHFAWKANETIIEAIFNVPQLSIELDFMISIYQKVS